MSAGPGISVVVFTYNEALNIDACLKSVAGWCDEVIVVDSGSTDRTQELCRRYTDRIYVHEYVDHASQLDWAVRNVPLACEWLMPLDADHVITQELKEQLTAAVASAPPGTDGYYAHHRYFFRGVPLRGFKPYSLRLVRRGKVRVDHSELVDFRLIVEGRTETLSGAVHESNLKEASIDFWIDKHQAFSSRLAAEEVLRRSGVLSWSMRPRLFRSHDERMIWLKNRWYRLPLYVRPFIYFAYRYVLRLGFLDGTVGFLYHFLQAFWFRLMVDVKIGQLREQLAKGELSLDQLRASFEHRF